MRKFLYYFKETLVFLVLITFFGVIAYLGFHKDTPAQPKPSVHYAGLMKVTDAPAGENSETKELHAVMFLIEFETKNGAIRHAQVIGGYIDMDQCRDAMKGVLATVAPQIESTLMPELHCLGVAAHIAQSKDTET